MGRRLSRRSDEWPNVLLLRLTVCLPRHGCPVSRAVALLLVCSDDTMRRWRRSRKCFASIKTFSTDGLKWRRIISSRCEKPDHAHVDEKQKEGFRELEKSGYLKQVRSHADS